jgi:hypothetical protein
MNFYRTLMEQGFSMDEAENIMDEISDAINSDNPIKGIDEVADNWNLDVMLVASIADHISN